MLLVDGRAAIAAAAVVALSLLAPAPGRAEDTKAVCAGAYDAIQVERRSGELAKAREAAAVCTNVACPDFIRHDCGEWLEQIDAAQPSLVLHVRRGRQDLTAVDVELDGRRWLDRLDGRATMIDPGQHVLRFTSEGVSVARPLLVVEGERNRLVEVDLDATPAGKKTPQIAPSRGPWIVGGIGVAALAAGGVMTGVLVHEKSINDHECPHTTCTPAGRSAAETGKVLGPITTASFVAGGVGVAAGALWLLMASRRPATAVLVAPLLTSASGGLAASVNF